jgi:hypothetical protein
MIILTCGRTQRTRIGSMKSGRVKAFLISFFLVLAPTMAHATAACTRDLSASAESALVAFDKRVKDQSVKEVLWPEFQALVLRYGACDDGALAEFFAEITIDMLRYHWKEAQSFAPLQGAAPLDRFVIRHVGATSLPEDLRSVRQNAAHRCGSQAALFCRDVVRACDEGLSYLKKVLHKSDL